MKKRRNRSKRKNKISYRSIITSGILIVAFIIFISFAFSNNRNYEVIIIDEQGNEEFYAEYPNFIQAKEAMLEKTDRDKKQNAAVRYHGKWIALGYGVVQFQRNSCTVNTTYRVNNTNTNGYLNGCYGNDAAYIDTNEDGTEILFKQAGVSGWVNTEDVTLHNIYDENDVSSISHYIVENKELSHKITTDIAKNTYANTLNLGTIDVTNGTYYSYDGHYFYNSYESMIDDYRTETFEYSSNKQPFYDYYQYLPHRSISNYTAEDINWYIRNYLGFSSTKESLLVNSGEWFIEAQNKYGTNAIMMFCVAMNESDLGRSDIAYEKNNLFGHAAYDESPSQSANGYKSIKDSIFAHAKNFLHNRYLNPTSFAYHGGFFGDKASGMNVSYASDPYWGEKAANYYRIFDTVMKKKDANISYIVTNKSIDVYKDRNMKNAIFQSKQIPSSFLVLNQGNDWLQIIYDKEITSENSYNQNNYIGYIKLDLTKNSYILQ